MAVDAKRYSPNKRILFAVNVAKVMFENNCLGCSSLTLIDCAVALVHLIYNNKKKSDVITFSRDHKMDKLEFHDKISYEDLKGFFTQVCQC